MSTTGRHRLDDPPTRRSFRIPAPAIAAVAAVALVVGAVVVVGGLGRDDDRPADLSLALEGRAPATTGASPQLAGLSAPGGAPASQAVADAANATDAAEKAQAAAAAAADNADSADNAGGGNSGDSGQADTGPRSPSTAGQPSDRAPRAAPLGVLGRSAAALFGWGAPDASKGDDFDGSGRPSGQWTNYDSAGNGGNGTRSSGQNTLRDGLLAITGTADGTTGGMMGGVQPAYGRWEVRMRVDKQGGGGSYHPVVALVPHGQAYDGGAGDLDFAETDAGSGKVYCFIHYPQRKQDSASTSVDLAQWHTYAVEVAPSHITWFVDGKALMTDTNRAALTGTPWTLNVQLDANQGGGLAPSSMQLDYFRYYPLPDGARTPSAPAPMTSSYGG